LSDTPAAVVLEDVVPFAEVREIAVSGGSPASGVDRVIEVTPPDGLSASGEPAALVAGAQESLHVFRRAIAVDREDTPRHR
jgi:hypothetical protein